MDDKTESEKIILDATMFKALEDSVVHWERLAACKTRGEYRAEGWRAKTCPLCCALPKIEPDEGWLHPCERCPVSVDVTDEECHGTPYYDAAFLLRKFTDYRPCTGSVTQKNVNIAVNKELDYLRDLLSRCEVK